MKTVVREGRLSILYTLLNHRYLELAYGLTSHKVAEFGQPTEAKDAVLDDDGNIIEEEIEASPHILVVEDYEIETPLRVEDKFIIPLLIEAVKELSAKITALENA